MEIEECLEPSMGGAEPCGAYTIMKRWYRRVFTRAPKPSRADMEKVRWDLHKLYQKEEPHPPGLPLATHVDPAKVNDEATLKAKVEASVLRLLPHRSGGHTHLCAEHFKQ